MRVEIDFFNWQIAMSLADHPQRKIGMDYHSAGAIEYTPVERIAHRLLLPYRRLAPHRFTSGVFSRFAIVVSHFIDVQFGRAPPLKIVTGKEVVKNEIMQYDDARIFEQHRKDIPVSG